MPDSQDMPRTLIVDFSQRFGGISSRILRMLQLFPEGRAALAGLEDGAVVRAAREQQVKHYAVDLYKGNPLIVRWLVKLIRREGWQVLDTQNIQSKLWASLAAARTDVALISTLNSWAAAEFGGNLKGRIYQAIELNTNRNLDLYIVVSTVDRDRLYRRGIPEEAVEVILNAIDIDPDSIEPNPEGLRQQFDIPAGAMIACAVGRLVWQKGYPDLIAAFRQIADEAPNLYCLIMGEGTDEEAIRQEIADAGLSQCMKLIGFRQREEVLSIVKSSDLFVMPSRYEGTPVALLEAAALGKPIVATRAGGIPDLVAHESHALLSDISDPAGLAQNLLRVYQNPELANRLSEDGQQHVLQNFSPKAQVEATRKAYQKAWERSRRRSSAR